MKNSMLSFLLVSVSFLYTYPQRSLCTVEVEPVSIDYQGKTVKAKKLVVRSEIPMPIEQVWNILMTAELLDYVTKGFLRMKPIGGPFPESWPELDTVHTKIRVFGFIPFGGTHSLFFEEICGDSYVLQTREKNNRAKIWDHRITLEPASNQATLYTDEVIIYGKGMTGLITAFAKQFYQHRQKRWQTVAKENWRFNE